MPGRAQVEEHIVVESVGLSLNVRLRAPSGQERVTVLVCVTELAADLSVKVLANYGADCEPVPNASRGRSRRGIDAAVPVDSVSGCHPDLPLLGETGLGHNQEGSHSKPHISK